MVQVFRLPLAGVPDLMMVWRICLLHVHPVDP
jgi:hypothetical protein